MKPPPEDGPGGPSAGPPKAGPRRHGGADDAPRGRGGVVPSPCISVCRMHEPSGWCEGCLRTLDEIAVWSVLDDRQKRAVWKLLPQRRDALAALAGKAP